MTWLLLLPAALAAGMALPTQFANFGQLGVPVHPASIPRLLRALLIIVGVAVVQRF